MSKEKPTLEDYTLAFPLLLASIYNQALKYYEQVKDDKDDVKLPDEDENPKEEATETEEELQNGVNYYYSDNCSDNWTGLNDDSEADKKMKDILDSFIFRIRTRRPDVDYNIKFVFNYKDKVRVFRFFWNKDMDRFEGSTPDMEDVFYYDELSKTFYVEGDICEECCDEAEDKKPYVAPTCEVKPKGAQITVQELEGRDIAKEEMKSTATALYNRLNINRKEKVKKYIEQVEVAAKRVIDYGMYLPLANEEGTVTAISFTADDLAANIPDIDCGDFENVLTSDEIVNTIKERFGFAAVKYDNVEEVYYADLV